MNIQGQRIISAPIQSTWIGLNDPKILKDCIPGCDSLEQSEPNRFDALVSVKLGPISARFKGEVQIQDAEPPSRYVLSFNGVGGAAGFAKGTAKVQLEPVADGTLLSYTAQAQVGGKIAQVGSRLLDTAATKLTGQFFERFDSLVGKPVSVCEDSSTIPIPQPRVQPAARKHWLLWLLVTLILLLGVVMAYR